MTSYNARKLLEVRIKSLTITNCGEAGSEAIIPLKPSVLAGIGKGIAQASNLKGGNEQPTTIVHEGDQHYTMNVHIENVGGTEQDARQLSDILNSEWIRQMRVERGVR